MLLCLPACQQDIYSCEYIFFNSATTPSSSFNNSKQAAAAVTTFSKAYLPYFMKDSEGKIV